MPYCLYFEGRETVLSHFASLLHSNLTEFVYIIGIQTTHIEGMIFMLIQKIPGIHNSQMVPCCECCVMFFYLAKHIATQNIPGLAL